MYTTAACNFALHSLVIITRHYGQILQILSNNYSKVWNKRIPTLIDFLTFFQELWPYSRLDRAYLSIISMRYKWGYAYSFCQIFQGLY